MWNHGFFNYRKTMTGKKECPDCKNGWLWLTSDPFFRWWCTCTLVFLIIDMDDYYSAQFPGCSYFPYGKVQTWPTFWYVSFVLKPMSGWLLQYLASNLNAGFFLTSVAEKTKTQAQNSSQKLKEKTQPQGGTFLLLRETQEKTQFFPKNSKNRKFFMGYLFLCHFC